MTPAANDTSQQASLAAMLTAGVLMAHQVGAKAARDAIFSAGAPLPASRRGRSARAQSCNWVSGGCSPWSRRSRRC